jgi:hypothetical protein
MRYFTAPLYCRLAAVPTDRPGCDVFGADALNAELVFTAEVITAATLCRYRAIVFCNAPLALRVFPGRREKSRRDGQ